MKIFIIILYLCMEISAVNLDFTINQKICSPDGYQRPCTLVNNQFPGPLIRVSQHEDVHVKVKNELGTKGFSF